MKSPGIVIGLGVPWGTEGLAYLRNGPEAFDPSAFDEQLRRGDVIRAQCNHARSTHLGDTADGTLFLYRGKLGLWCRIALPDNGAGHDAARKVKSGEYKGMSISFRELDFRWGGTRKHPIRIVTRARLSEISLCRKPAYGRTCRFLRWAPAKDEPRTVTPARTVRRARPANGFETTCLPPALDSAAIHTLAETRAEGERLYRLELASCYKLP